DVMLQLAEPEDWALERFSSDAINGGYDFAPEEWIDWTLADGSACQIPNWVHVERRCEEQVIFNEEGEIVARMVEGGHGFSQVCWPLAREDWTTCLDDLACHTKSICWRSLPESIFKGGLDEANLKRITSHLKNLRRNREQAIVLATGTALFAAACGFRGVDKVLMDLAAAPARPEALLDKIVELHLARIGRLLPAFADNVDVVWIGDDLGMEIGPFLSPQMFRDVFKPRYRIIVDHVKKTSPQAKVFLHSCGSIYKLIPDLIEIGFDILNPVQISARDMEPARLKCEFGDVITFWGGGCDTQHVLPWATPQQVRDHVRHNIDVFAPGGGYVFCPVHNILSDVPPENIVALFEAAMEY
ncbi:MAG: hypothetical protein JSW66_08180, partial [Phycisphaerales bacterium]